MSDNCVSSLALRCPSDEQNDIDCDVLLYLKHDDTNLYCRNSRGTINLTAGSQDPLPLSNGSESFPSYTFASNRRTGMMLYNNNLTFSVDSSKALACSNDYIELYKPLRVFAYEGKNPPENTLYVRAGSLWWNNVNLLNIQPNISSIQSNTPTVDLVNQLSSYDNDIKNITNSVENNTISIERIRNDLSVLSDEFNQNNSNTLSLIEPVKEIANKVNLRVDELSTSVLDARNSFEPIIKGLQDEILQLQNDIKDLNQSKHNILDNITNISESLINSKLSDNKHNDSTTAKINELNDLIGTIDNRLDEMSDTIKETNDVLNKIDKTLEANVLYCDNKIENIQYGDIVGLSGSTAHPITNGHVVDLAINENPIYIDVDILIEIIESDESAKFKLTSHTCTGESDIAGRFSDIIGISFIPIVSGKKYVCMLQYINNIRLYCIQIFNDGLMLSIVASEPVIHSGKFIDCKAIYNEATNSLVLLTINDFGLHATLWNVVRSESLDLLDLLVGYQEKINIPNFILENIHSIPVDRSTKSANNHIFIDAIGVPGEVIVISCLNLKTCLILSNGYNASFIIGDYIIDKDSIHTHCLCYDNSAGYLLSVEETHIGDCYIQVLDVYCTTISILKSKKIRMNLSNSTCKPLKLVYNALNNNFTLVIKSDMLYIKTFTNVDSNISFDSSFRLNIETFRNIHIIDSKLIIHLEYNSLNSDTSDNKQKRNVFLTYEESKLKPAQFIGLIANVRNNQRTIVYRGQTLHTIDPLPNEFIGNRLYMKADEVRSFPNNLTINNELLFIGTCLNDHMILVGL